MQKFVRNPWTSGEQPKKSNKKDEPKNESTFIKVEENPELCEMCYKNEAQEPHPCPYQEDINDNHEDLCTCCVECTNECVMDI
jgi:hypothetical protein